MATASEILSAIAPQFDDASGRDVLLGIAESRTSSTAFGPNRPEAVAYRAAHMLALSTSSARADGAAGAITSKSEGDLSVSFSAPQASGTDLELTHYGQHLLGLMRSCVPAAGVTGVPFVPFLSSQAQYPWPM